MKATQSAVLDLPEIADVQRWSAADEKLFDELRAVLEKHGAIARFGITLLHKHFDVADDEVLVEVCDRESRTLLTRPLPATGLSATNVIETNWRFDVPNVVARKCWQVCEFLGPRRHAKIHKTYDDPKT
jgi:hypothetical protein